MAERKKGKARKNSLVIEFPANSNLPERLQSLVEKTGLDVCELLQKWVTQEENAFDTRWKGLTKYQKRTVEALEEYIRDLKQKDKTSAAPATASVKKAAPEKSKPAKKTAEPKQSKKEDVVKKIKALKAEGLAFKAIADRLNEEGIPTISGKGKWYGSSVALAEKKSSK
jgi:hypothetical protein